MLSNAVMGALALGILWVNTLLVAAAAVKAALSLARMNRGLGDVSRGMTLRGDGPDGALAALDLEQLGRLSGGNDPVILFHDRSRVSRVFGGRVALEDGPEIDLAPSEDAEVWLNPSAVAQAAIRRSEADFDRATREARKARGFSRALRVPIVAGAKVFVATGLVATLDPRRWIAQRIVLAYAFVCVELVVAGACTALSLTTPLFGTVSMAGAAAAFAFFLLVQPAGTWLRDALRPPSRAPSHDTWTRTQPPAGEASPEATRSSS